MSRSLRRAALTSLLGASFLVASALGQREVKKAAPPLPVPLKDEKGAKDDFGDSSAISLPRDNKLKHHPSLVPWEHLPQDERDKDYDAIRDLTKVLADAGLQIVRLGERTASTAARR